MNIVAAAAAHQHKLQHLLMLTEQHVMYYLGSGATVIRLCNTYSRRVSKQVACGNGLQTSLYVIHTE